MNEQELITEEQAIEPEFIARTIANDGGFNKRRFSGENDDGAAAYQVWKKWAKAAIVEQWAKNMPDEALGPWLYAWSGGAGR